jgi:RimJ/RimL family protein N-acetyltransferase
MGAEHAQTLLRSVQRLDRIDPRRLGRLVERAAQAAPQYSLVRWTGHCPDDLLDAYAHTKAGMLDAPVSDDLDFEPPRARPDVLRGCEELYERLGLTEYVLCARHNETGELAGTTQVWIVGGIRADQGDTTVLRAHRGHRLGFLLKASMVLWLAEQEPELHEIQTWNDPDNEPMLRVNQQLLYRPSELWDDWSKQVT